MIRILSLGAGVQSSALLMMSIEGVLPKLDAAVFADTGWEPAAVYKWLDWISGKAAAANCPLYRVSAGSIRSDLMGPTASPRGRKKDGERNTCIPFHTLAADGSKGILRRQCTKEYKIEPIDRCIRQRLLKLAPRQIAPPNSVEQWFGISVEEQRRVRISDARWKTHRYPLIFDLPRAFTRHDCLNWMQERGYPRPPRSACIGCPFHSNEEWRALSPEEFADACEFDEAIRHKGGVRGDLFLHRNAVPLVQVDLSRPEDHGQGAFDWKCESGYCGT